MPSAPSRPWPSLAVGGASARTPGSARPPGCCGENEARLQAGERPGRGAAPQYGLCAAEIDRLRLTPKVIESMAASLEAVAVQTDPIGEVIDSSIRPNGLEVRKVRVPLGVVFFIYESRPNVTSDAAAIAVKSGNAVILRGGKEAAHSNRAIADLLAAAAAKSVCPRTPCNW